MSELVLSSSSSSETSSSSSTEPFIVDKTQNLIPNSNSNQLQTQSQLLQTNLTLTTQSTDISNSQSTHPPLSSFTNNNPLTQETQTTSIQNTQSTSLSTSNLNTLHKSVPLTAPTRAWISPRITKAIHIEKDDLNHPDQPQPMQLDPNHNHSTPNSSSQRIIDLGILEEHLSQLLNLASDVLGSLTPPLDQDHQSSTDQAIETFSSSITQYFELLNKIQLGLRTSMAHLRLEKISTQILFEPIHIRVPNCPVGLGNLKLDPSTSTIPSCSFNSNQFNIHPIDHVPNLSLGSLFAERNAWKDFVDSLQSIKALHSLNPSNSFIPSS